MSSVQVLPAVQRWIGLKVVDQALPVVHSNFAGCRGSVARGAWDDQRLAEAAAGLCKGASRRSKQKHMSREVAKRLQEHFREHNRRFEELSGMATGDWDEGPVAYGPPPLRARAKARAMERKKAAKR